MPTRLQLTRLVLLRPQDGGSFVGDPCQRIGCVDSLGRHAVLGVYSVRRSSGMVIRYLSCNVCGWRPEDNKFVVPDPDRDRDLPGQRYLFENDPDGDS